MSDKKEIGIGHIFFCAAGLLGLGFLAVGSYVSDMDGNAPQGGQAPATENRAVPFGYPKTPFPR